MHYCQYVVDSVIHDSISIFECGSFFESLMSSVLYNMHFLQIDICIRILEERFRSTNSSYTGFTIVRRKAFQRSYSYLMYSRQVPNAHDSMNKKIAPRLHRRTYLDSRDSSIFSQLTFLPMHLLFRVR